MSSSSKNAFAIPSFDGSKEHWLLWRARFKAAMTGRGWWKFVEKPNDQTSSSAVSANSSSASSEESDHALSALVLALPDDLLQAYGVDATDAASIWQRLVGNAYRMGWF